MLLEDKEDRVKISVIHSLAFMVTFVDDDDKYAQVCYIVYDSFKKVHHYNIELFGYESIRNEKFKHFLYFVFSKCSRKV